MLQPQYEVIGKRPNAMRKIGTMNKNLMQYKHKRKGSAAQASRKRSRIVIEMIHDKVHRLPWSMFHFFMVSQRRFHLNEATKDCNSPTFNGYELGPKAMRKQRKGSKKLIFYCPDIPTQNATTDSVYTDAWNVAHVLGCLSITIKAIMHSHLN